MTKKTPALDKMQAERVKTQAAHDFVEHFRSKGIVLAEHHEHSTGNCYDEDMNLTCKKKHEHDSGCYYLHSHGQSWRSQCGMKEGLYSWTGSLDREIAECFGVDLDECERERMTILEEIQRGEP